MIIPSKGAAALGAAALGCVLVAPAWGQTRSDTLSGERSASEVRRSASGCDKLTGKARNDCMAQLRSDEAGRSAATGASRNPPLPGVTTGPQGESGPTTMERPAGADTSGAEANPGGALAPGAASSGSGRRSPREPAAPATGTSRY